MTQADAVVDGRRPSYCLILTVDRLTGERA
jgi:hypothetical protein